MKPSALAPRRRTAQVLYFEPASCLICSQLIHPVCYGSRDWVALNISPSQVPILERMLTLSEILGQGISTGYGRHQCPDPPHVAIKRAPRMQHQNANSHL
jgi:hypothetical protein